MSWFLSNITPYIGDQNLAMIKESNLVPKVIFFFIHNTDEEIQ
jgi:hypothetical protein